MRDQIRTRIFDRLPHRRLFFLMLALLVLPGAGRPAAQSADAFSLKAAFVYNFAKFTEWPEDVLSPNAPLVLCLAGDARLQHALEEATKGREVEGHPVLIRKVDEAGDVPVCHLLYADSLDAKRARQIVARVNGMPVLSVSDFDRFAQLGGVAHLFVEDGRMRFAVNLDAANRSKLRLSSKLLSLAKIVKDDPNAVRP